MNNRPPPMSDAFEVSRFRHFCDSKCPPVGSPQIRLVFSADEPLEIHPPQHIRGMREVECGERNFDRRGPSIPADPRLTLMGKSPFTLLASRVWTNPWCGSFRSFWSVWIAVSRNLQFPRRNWVCSCTIIPETMLQFESRERHKEMQVAHSKECTRVLPTCC